MEMNGALPRFRKDDVGFVCSVLARYGKSLVNATQIVRDLGLRDRGETEGHTPEYSRVLAALHKARELGLVVREAREWGLVNAPSAPAAARAS